jgi:hypothetical protein
MVSRAKTKKKILRVSGALLLVLLTALASGCSQWSWNPKEWDLFGNKAPAPPPVVDVLAIESTSGDPGGERFEQSWDGTRLVIDIYSPNGIGRATLKPRDQGWPLRLVFRLHLGALEGFEARGAQNMRFSLGSTALSEPAVIDLPYGIVAKDSPQLDIQWVDRYR